jgi:hypothetical protein
MKIFYNNYVIALIRLMVSFMRNKVNQSKDGQSKYGLQFLNMG